MTAPLPPHDDIDPNGNHLYRASTVKLAVREALQRLLDLEDDGMDLLGEARAMLKDYE
jgi:hypothetical protein